MKTSNNIVLIFSLLTLFSCNKKDEKVVLYEPASISLISPIFPDTINSGETLHIDGSVSSDHLLGGYHIQLYRDENDSLLLSNGSDIEANSYILHEHWLNTYSDTFYLKLSMIVFKGGSNFEVMYFNDSVLCLP